MGNTGSAGPAGDDVRSDLNVTVELTESASVEIDLVSRVEPYYGKSIRRDVIEVLRSMGVAGARVSVNDGGALRFVIAARVEAAAIAAGITGSEALPERAYGLPDSVGRNRLRRSRLYLPGNSPKLMVNASLHGPDGMILDLEDSVHPGAKDEARILVRNALRCIDFGGAERMVRINPLPAGRADLCAVLPQGPDMILVPKVEHPEQVLEVDRLIGERALGRDVWIMPIIETALGVENAFRIASASARVAALTLGLEDLTADLGVVKTNYGSETLYARQRTVNAARAAGVQAIDSVFGDVGDVEGLKGWAKRSRSLGFEGMGCVHPRQIEPINSSFSPSEREISRAVEIVDAFADAQRKGLGVVSLGSKMIDPPVVERARRLVDRAVAIGLISEDRGGSDG